MLIFWDIMSMQLRIPIALTLMVKFVQVFERIVLLG
jgi:hypothetical protein